MPKKGLEHPRRDAFTWYGWFIVNRSKPVRTAIFCITIPVYAVVGIFFGILDAAKDWRRDYEQMNHEAESLQ